MGALAQNRPDTKGRVYPCMIAEIAAASDDEDRKAIEEDVANRAISVRAIARWLGTSETPVARHRQGLCACHRG